MQGRRAAPYTAALLATLLLSPLVAGCGLFDFGSNDEAPPPERTDVNRRFQQARAARPNIHAWQAARDVLTFLRIKTSDYYGGVLATDWYRPKSAPNERLRVTVVVMSQALSTDTIRVSVIKQRLQRGEWRDTPVSANTVQTIHARIFNRAKKLQAESGL